MAKKKDGTYFDFSDTPAQAPSAGTARGTEFIFNNGVPADQTQQSAGTPVNATPAAGTNAPGTGFTMENNPEIVTPQMPQAGQNAGGITYTGTSTYKPQTAAGTAERPDYSSLLQQWQNGDNYRAYSAAMQKISEGLKNGPPIYSGQYDAKLMDAYDQIVGRKPFEYDAESDPLYGIYRDQYTDLGKMAMKDTMGQAAMLTGGYSNTYGQRVGQQAYNAYMQQLANIIPQLEQRAYDRWNDQGDLMMQQYAMLADLRDTDYGRYRDEVSDYNNRVAMVSAQNQQEQEYLAMLQSLANEEEATQYSRGRDLIADQRYEDETAYQRAWNEEQRNYDRYRDQISDRRYEDETAYQRNWNEDQRDYERLRDQIADSRYYDELAYERAWNEDERDYNRMMDQVALANKASGGSSGGGGGGSYGGGTAAGIDPIILAGQYNTGGDRGLDGMYYDPRELSGYTGDNPSGLSTEATQRMLNNLIGANLTVNGKWDTATKKAWNDYLEQEAKANEFYQGLVDQYVTFR